MCLRFVPGNDVVYDLRGGPVFERELSAFHHRWLGWLVRAATRGHRVILHPPGTTETRIRGCETCFVPMPGNPTLAGVLESRAFYGVIVDYHADVLRLLHYDDAAPDMRKAGQTVPDEAWEWWAEPERQESLTRGLAAADVITTPWAGLVGPLGQRFGKPVIHLPDTHPGSTRAFRRVWRREVAPAMRRINGR